MATIPARTLASRLRNVVAFVLIVWGVATTFVAFEVLSLRGTDLVSSYPTVFGDIALSRVVTESTTCVMSDTSDMPPAKAGVNDGGANAWLLGLNLGRDAVVRQVAGSSSPLLAQLTAASSELATRLGVPAPATFRHRQLANANTEFVAFAEQGAGDTAQRLAADVSPQACELFKLGAFWGYSEMVRPSLPGERAVFAMEIRYHAQRAEVPERLWNAMLQRIPADSKPDEVITQMTALTEGLTTYLAGR